MAKIKMENLEWFLGAWGKWGEETNYVCLQRLFCFSNTTLCTFSENKMVLGSKKWTYTTKWFLNSLDIRAVRNGKCSLIKGVLALLQLLSEWKPQIHPLGTVRRISQITRVKESLSLQIISVPSYCLREGLVVRHKLFTWKGWSKRQEASLGF